MNRRLLLPAVLGLVLAGCESREEMPAWPPFVMTIPDDVPEALVVRDGSGRERTVDGREVYASGYRSGWRECVRRHEEGRLDLDERTVGDRMPRRYGPAAQGWDDGFQACRVAIRDATPTP